MNLNDLYLVRDALDTALTGGGNDADVVDALQLIENDIQATGIQMADALKESMSAPTEVIYGDQDNEVSDSGDGQAEDVVAEANDTPSSPVDAG